MHLSAYLASALVFALPSSAATTLPETLLGLNALQPLGLSAAELNLAAHLDKILECARDFGKPETLAAIAHALQFGAFGAAYVHNIILQRLAAKGQRAPQPVVLTKKPEWADVAVEETDLGLYDDLFSDENKGGADA